MEKIFNSLINEININGKIIKITFNKVSLVDDILYISNEYDTKTDQGIEYSDRVLNHLVTKKIDNIKLHEISKNITRYQNHVIGPSVVRTYKAGCRTSCAILRQFQSKQNLPFARPQRFEATLHYCYPKLRL